MRRASMRRMREDPERRGQRREVGQRQHGQPARQRQRFRQLRHRGCAWTVHLRGAASLGGQVVLSQARVFLLGAVALPLQLADPAVPLRVQAARLAGVGEASGGPVDVAFVRGEQPQERVARRTGERGNLEREVLPGGGAGVEVGRQVERAGPLDQMLQALVDALAACPDAPAPGGPATTRTATPRQHRSRGAGTHPARPGGAPPAACGRGRRPPAKPGSWSGAAAPLRAGSSAVSTRTPLPARQAAGRNRIHEGLVTGQGVRRTPTCSLSSRYHA